MASIRRPNPSLSDSVFDMFNMRGRVVIITGGSGGIGYQIGRAVAEAGANVALWYDRSTQTEQLAATLTSDFGIKAKAYQCSVQNFDQVCAALFPSKTTFIECIGQIHHRHCHRRLWSSRCYDCQCRYPFQSRRTG